MDPLQQALARQLAQVAPDGVLGQAELPADVLGDDTAVASQDLQDMSLALSGQHGTARFIMIMHDPVYSADVEETS